MLQQIGIKLILNLISFGLKAWGDLILKKMLDRVSLWYADLKDAELKKEIQERINNLDLQARALAVRRNERFKQP